VSGDGFAYRVVTSTVKGIIRATCKIDDDLMAQVPEEGPLIIVSNHINFLEVPLFYTHLTERRDMVGFAKAEVWKNPILGPLADLWGATPLHRGEADMAALRYVIGKLKEGYILGVAPEGTRSGDGRMQRGNPGIVLLALRSGAPLLPLPHWGGERFFPNLARLRRTDFRFALGQQFYLDPGGVRVTSEVRQEMIDEVMYQIAALLPAYYRGVYSDMENATERYLRFPPGSSSNLQPALKAQQD
jgi:1-acyl-sn-glycerol-3-phosphate acyltransferase